MPDATIINPFQGGFLVRISNELRRQFRDGLSNGLVESLEGQKNWTLAFGRELQGQVRIGSGLATTNDAIAKSMQRRTLYGYSQLVEKRKRGPSYRVGAKNRYGGGYLRAAISAPSFARGTQAGIRFGDFSENSARAKHWARLQFGTAGGGQLKGPLTARLGFPGEPEFLNVTFSDPPRASFGMPRGYFTGPGRSRLSRAGGSATEFYPTGRSQEFLTKGIAARRYLDEGLRALESEFPVQYSKRFETYVKLAARAAPLGPLTRNESGFL